MKALTNLLILFSLLFAVAGEAKVIYALEDITIDPVSGSDIILNGAEVQINGKLIVLNTDDGAVACPVMTETQRDAISAAIEGECVFNSDTSSLNIYDGASWASVGTTLYSNPNPLYADTERFGAGTTDALAIGATAFGTNAVASGTDSVALGFNAIALGASGIAIGHESDAVGSNSTAVGFNTTATGDSSIALGAGATVTANDGIAIGLSANANVGSVAIGWSSANTGQLGVTIGRNNDTTFDRVVGIGANGLAGALNAVAIGYNADTTGANSILLGADIVGGAYTDVVIIGEGITATANNELNIADTITGDLSTGDVTIANDLTITNDLIISGTLSGNTVVSGSISNPDPLYADTEKFGVDAVTSALRATAFGHDAVVTMADSVAFGYNSDATGTISTAIGANANAAGNKSTSVGYAANSSIAEGTAVGASAVAGSSGVSLGKSANAGTISVALGHSAQATAQESVAVGRIAVANAIDAVAIGGGATAGDGGVSIGQNADGTGVNTIVLGHESQASTYTNVILIGEGLTATANDELNIDGIITGDMSTGAVTVSGTLSTPRLELTGMDSSLIIGGNAGGGEDYTNNENTVFGKDAYVVGTGTGNTIMGYAAGAALTTQTTGTFIGVHAGGEKTAGLDNTAVGYYSQGNKTTGSQNTTMGQLSGQYLTGSNNTGIGVAALRGTSGGSSAAGNVAVGRQAGEAITTGQNNVLLGYAVSKLNTTGDYNIVIGYNLQTPTTTSDYYLTIGDIITGDISTGAVSVSGTLSLGDFTTAALPSASASSGSIAFDTTLSEPVFSDGSTWESLAGGGGDPVITDLDTFYRDDFSVNTTTFFSVTGDSATPDNAGTGTFQGTLIGRTTTSAMNGIRDNGMLTDGGGTNDFFLSDTISVSEVAASQTATFSFYYEYNGADDDMSFIVLDSTNDAVISHATNHDLKLTSEPTRFYATIDIPSTCTDIRYGFQRNAGTLKSLYFTDVTFKTPMLELFQTKFLTADITTTTDISDLQFDNLTIGRTYNISGLLFLQTGTALEVLAFSAASGGGTNYGIIGYATNANASIVGQGQGVNKTFVAVSDTLYLRTTNPFAQTLSGDNTNTETHVTLTELVDVAETTKF